MTSFYFSDNLQGNSLYSNSYYCIMGKGMDERLEQGTVSSGLVLSQASSSRILRITFKGSPKGTNQRTLKGGTRM